MFVVRRAKVLDALKWLCQYNVLYRKYKVVINSSNLDWMEGENEAIIPVATTHDSFEVNFNDDADLGPSPSQTLMEDKTDEEAEYDVAGTLMNENSFIPNEEDLSILSKIKKTQNNKNVVVDWPTFSSEPISEYSDMKVFCMLFPWSHLDLNCCPNQGL
jgi:hypothetical protein